MTVRITQFSPLDGFRRMSWEFQDDHVTVNVKSLSLDFDHEVRYDKIKTITNNKRLNLNWLWVTVVVVVLAALLSLFLPNLGVSKAEATLAAQLLAVVGYACFIPAFRKIETYSFLDAEDNYLTVVFVNERNKKTLFDAIDLIRQKEKGIQEIYIEDPLPSSPPVFQYSQFDLLHYMSRSTVSFYDDRLIEVHRSLAADNVTLVKYGDLGQTIKTVRAANDNWDYVFTNWLMFVSIVGGTAIVFFRQQLACNYPFLYLMAAGYILLIPMFLLRYKKREFLVFYDKHDQAVFGARVDSANREELERAVAFVRGKVAPGNQPASGPVPAAGDRLNTSI